MSTVETGKVFCQAANTMLLVGNFNDDGNQDLMCHNRDTGWLKSNTFYLLLLLLLLLST